MSRLSLVTNRIRDPRKLPYLYRTMPASRYKELSEDYYRTKSLEAVEEAAQIGGLIVVPSACIHHKRRQADRRISLLGRTYYLLREDEMTDLELAKYRSLCIEREDANEQLREDQARA